MKSVLLRCIPENTGHIKYCMKVKVGGRKERKKKVNILIHITEYYALKSSLQILSLCKNLSTERAQ